MDNHKSINPENNSKNYTKNITICFYSSIIYIKFGTKKLILCITIKKLLE